MAQGSEKQEPPVYTYSPRPAGRGGMWCGSVGLKVSEKGGVSVYGLGRFPVTLYKEQWAKLLDMAGEIRAFIKENDSKLKAKEQ